MKRTLCSLTAILFALIFIITPFKKANAAAQSPITRSEAERRALNMINLKWTYSSSKNGKIDPSLAQYVTQPDQFKNMTTGEVTGIPYDWGGLDGLNSNSINTPWTNFLDAISKGAYAGNVNTNAGHGYIQGTAGIDCSGFVQAVFNINDSKLSTSTLFNTYFKKIDIKDIKHMDILDRPGDHVVIFDRWGTLNGVEGAFTYESTYETIYGGIQGTKQYFLTIDDLNNGYIPGRYINIVDDESLPHPVDTGIFAQISTNISYANLRANPSTSAAILKSMPRGSIIYVADYSSGWYKINYNGQAGWVWGELIYPIPSGKYVTVKNAYQVNIRTNPSSASQILGIIKQGQYAEVLGYSSSGNWYKISINGIQGWAYKGYLSYIY